MKKFLIYLRLYWVRILLITLFICALVAISVFVFFSINQFLGLERFIRQNMMAQYGILFLVFTLVHIVSMPLMLWMQQYFIQGGGLGKVGFEKQKPNVKWNEVIGMEEAKKEAWELVKLLKDRALLKQVGGKIIKGTMFLGPPGCGKTYLAKAIAAETDLPLISTVGSEFIGMFVGQGTARMKSLFKHARAMAKIHGGCIIFIDEIDSFARPRGADMGFGGGRLDMNSTINQFLTEMDGLRNAENNIVVIAATNVQEHELDSAIMRAGRFDRKVNVRRPNLKEREQIFKLYLSKVECEPAVNANVLARKTVWFTPAEIESTVREASLIANRDGRKALNMKDLDNAYERVSFGQKSNIILSDKEKYMTAYHETGHALLYYLIHPTDDVMKATIIPRGGALGYVFARPEEEVHGRSKEDLLADIKISIASYVVERKKFGTSTTGVGGGPGADFFTAMGIAHSMVWHYGMGPSGLIGDFTNLTRHQYSSTYLSEQTKSRLDEDIQEILQECLRDVERIINENWECVVYFSEELYKKEELNYDQIEEIFTHKFKLQRAKKPSTLES